MKKITVPLDADELLRLAECLATAIAEIGVSTRTEAQLRAGIAAAKFAISRHTALTVAAEHHAIAASFLNEARELRERSLSRLRRRVKGLIAELHTGNKHVARTANQLLAVGA